MLLQHSINNVAHATARPSPGRWLYLEQTLKQSAFNSCSHSQGVPTLQSTWNMCPHEAHTAMGHQGSGDHAAHLPQIVQTLLGPAFMAITQERSDSSCEVLIMSPGFLLAGNNAQILDRPLCSL